MDDGINAAGGADSSGFGGARSGQEQFAASSNSFIIINGGSFAIVSTGDCIDSNGSLTINGGTLKLTCNGSGNTAIDCDGTYANNGGDVTTNDGSESNPGQMGGGMAGPGGMGQGRGGHLAEIQLRTIAIDFWAALEHQMKYKKNVEHEKIIWGELKRCADEIASVDVSMQTLQELILNDQWN